MRAAGEHAAEALDALDRFRILRRIGPPTQDGQLWELAFNQPDIDWEGLEQRKARKAAMEKKRTAAARRARAARRQEARSSVGQNTGSSVGQNTGGLWDRRNQTQVLNDDGDPESPDQDHQTNKRGWDEETRALVAVAWKGMGLSKPLRDTLLHRDPETALGLLYHAHSEAKTNAAGLLRTMLQNGDEPMAKYAEEARRVLAGETGGAEYTALVIDAMRRVEEFLNTHGRTNGKRDKAPPEVAALDEVQPGMQRSIRDAWLITMWQLEAQLYSSTFDTWFRNATPGRFVDGELTVIVRNSYAQEYLSKYFPNLGEMLSEFAGVPVTVKYECGLKLFEHHLDVTSVASSNE